MADRYWRGGTGTWNTSNTTNWSATSGGAGGASVPTAADNVIFDQAATYTVTMTGIIFCLNITVSAGTVTFGSGATSDLTVSGSMSLVAGTVWGNTTNGELRFDAITTGKTITTNGTVLNVANLSFYNASNSGGEWTFVGALTCNTNSIVQHWSGTINLNGSNFTVGIYNGNSNEPRTVVFGANNIVLTAQGGSRVLDVSYAPNFNWTGTGGFSASSNAINSFQFGTITPGLSANAPNLTITGTGTAAQTFVSSASYDSYFNNINFGTSACSVTTSLVNVNSITLSASGTYTSLSIRMSGTGTITPNGKTISQFYVQTPGTATLAGAINCAQASFYGGSVNFATNNLTASANIGFNNTTTLSNVGTITCATFDSSGGDFLLTSGNLNCTGVFSVYNNFTYAATAGTLSIGSQFAHVSGTVTLSKALTITVDYAFTAGTLTLDGANLSVSRFLSSNANTRAINFSTNFIFTTSTTAGLANVSMATATGFSASGTGGFSAIASITRTFTVGTTAAPTVAPNLFITSGTSVQTFTTGSYFGQLDFGSSNFTVAATTLNLYGVYFSVGNYLSMALNIVGTGSIIGFDRQVSALTINHTGTTTFVGGSGLTVQGVTTLTQGTIDLSASSTGLSTLTFSSNNGNVRGINFGANFITTFTGTAATVNVSMANCTNFTATGTGGFSAVMSTTRTFTIGSSAAPARGSAPSLFLVSGTSGITITNGSHFRHLSYGTTTNAPSAIGISVGSLTLGNATSYINLIVTCNSTGTITSNAKTLGTLTINNLGGTTTFNGTVTLNGSPTTTLTAGTLDLNGTTFQSSSFSSSGSQVRAITFGTSGNILITGTLSMADATNFSCSGTNGFRSAMSATRTFTVGTTGAPTIAPNLFITSGASIPTLTTGSYFDKVDFTGSTCIPATTSINVNSLTLATGGTYTGLSVTTVGTGAISGNSKTITGLTINCPDSTTTLGSALTVSGTTNLVAGTLEVSSALTTAIFTSNNTNVRGINFGSTNIGLNSSIPSTTVLDIATATNFTATTTTGGFSADASIIRIFTVGTTAPPASVNVAPNLRIYTSTITPNITSGSYFRELSFTNSQCGTGTTTVNVASLILSSLAGGTFAGLSVNFLNSDASPTNFNFQPVGKTLAAVTVNLTNNASSVSYFNTSGSGCSSLTLTSGTFYYANTASTFAVSGAFTTNGGALSSGDGTNVLTCATFSCPGTFTHNTGAINPSTSITVAGNFTYNGVSGATFAPPPTFTQTGNVTITNVNCDLTTSTGTYTLTSGTLTLGTLDYVQVGIFSSDNSNTRAIVFGTGVGAGKIRLFHPTAGTVVVAMATTTGLTVSGVGGFQPYMTATKTLTIGSTANNGITGAPNITFEVGSSAPPTFTAGSWVNTIDFGTSFIAPIATNLNVQNIILTTTGTSSSNYYNNFSPTMRGTGTITPNSKVINSLVIDNTNGTTTLAGNLYLTQYSGTAFSQTSGTFNLATYRLQCYTANAQFSGGNFLNIGTIQCDGFSVLGGTFDFTQGTLQISVSTGLTINGGTLNYNGGTLNAVDAITHTSGTAIFSAAYAMTNLGMYTFTAGTLQLNGADLTVGQFFSSNINVRTINFGTNYIVQNYRDDNIIVISLSVLENFTALGSGGFKTQAEMPKTITVGNSGGTAISYPNLFFTGTGVSAPTLTTGNKFGTLNFGTTAFTLLASTQNVKNLVLSASGTYTSLTIATYGVGTLNGNGKSLSTLSISNGSGNTTTLAGNIGVNGQINLTTGSLNLAGYTLTAGTFNSSISGARSISGGGTITITGATWTVSTGAGFTGSDYTIRMTSASAKSFNASTLASYGTLVQAGAGTLNVNGAGTYADIQATTTPSTIVFAASATHTFTAFTLSGNAGNLVTIQSSVSGTQFTLSKASGAVNAAYLSIKDSNATGGATWNAINATNVSNNSGWVFKQPATGNFMAFF